MIYLISVVTFVMIILFLVGILSIVENKVIGKGLRKLIINNKEELTREVDSGSTILNALTDAKIFIPSACGGGGSCGMCKVKVTDGGGDVLPTEYPHLTRKERKEQVRLGCQVKVRDDVNIEIPDEIFNIKKYECEVISNDNVATFIKELKLKLPDNEVLDFKAGGYIQIDIPAFKNLSFKSFDVDKNYHPDWDKFKVWNYVASNDEETFRAYSMANCPAELGTVMLNVRIATPPPGKNDVLPGIGSSYIFNLKAGDKVTISGPYGEFEVKESGREMCFVGGGAGMAPMRSQIFDELKSKKTKRKMSYWYGARSKREMFYDEEFKKLAKSNSNFSYHVALSDPMSEDNWEGMVGFIHQCLYDNYLKDHEDPTEVEYYLCGPPMMLSAMLKMLDAIGVEKEMIAFDDFGS